MMDVLAILREFGFPTMVAIYALVRLEFHVMNLAKELRKLNDSLIVHIAKDPR